MGSPAPCPLMLDDRSCDRLGWQPLPLSIGGRRRGVGWLRRENRSADRWVLRPSNTGRVEPFTCADLERVAAVVAQAWRGAADGDWSVPAGTLEWSCAKTAAHTVDTVLAPAFFLASRRRDRYPDGEWRLPSGADAEGFATGLELATRILTAVVRDTPADVRSIIWRQPEPVLRPPADFVPRGGVELVLHAHDVCAGLGVSFAPPADAMDRLRHHVEDWPYWTDGPPWAPLSLSGDPWEDLLRSAGRS